MTALAITPGLLRSEAVLEALGVTEANWRDGIEEDPYSPSPRRRASSPGRWRLWPPDDMDRFVVRSRLYQAELDPSAIEEAVRLRAWLDRQR